ncbi:MAG: hypothetical protein ACYCO3_02915 [Mycobacteriales bacterium]
MSAYPVAPAARALTSYARSRGLSVRELPATLGLPVSLIRQCFEGRWLRARSADRLACALGRHPYELWPEWFGAP